MTFVEILSSFVAVILGVFTMFAARYLRSCISDNTWESLKFWVNEAVNAAEQVYKMQEKSGNEKRELVEEMLAELQLDLGETEKNILIESAVSRIKSEGKT